MFYEKGDAFITLCDKCAGCKHPEGSSQRWSLSDETEVRTSPGLKLSAESENSVKAWKDIKQQADTKDAETLSPSVSAEITAPASYNCSERVAPRTIIIAH